MIKQRVKKKREQRKRKKERMDKVKIKGMLP